ncbi:MAG: hypothetical protein ACLPTJ_03585 [Solirubrobacteraceae bacterium]
MNRSQLERGRAGDLLPKQLVRALLALSTLPEHAAALVMLAKRGDDG